MARLNGMWSALAEVPDPEEREELALVAVAIQITFAGRAVRERSVVEHMAARFRWSPARTRRRLESLVDRGILRCSRDLSDGWSKVFEVLDRPHVPPAFAVEMGA